MRRSIFTVMRVPEWLGKGWLNTSPFTIKVGPTKPWGITPHKRCTQTLNNPSSERRRSTLFLSFFCLDDEVHLTSLSACNEIPVRPGTGIILLLLCTVSGAPSVSKCIFHLEEAAASRWEESDLGGRI
jgi:hypothetical protein